MDHVNYMHGLDHHNMATVGEDYMVWLKTDLLTPAHFHTSHEQTSTRYLSHLWQGVKTLGLGQAWRPWRCVKTHNFDTTLSNAMAWLVQQLLYIERRQCRSSYRLQPIHTHCSTTLQQHLPWKKPTVFWARSEPGTRCFGEPAPKSSCWTTRLKRPRLVMIVLVLCVDFPSDTQIVWSWRTWKACEISSMNMPATSVKKLKHFKPSFISSLVVSISLKTAMSQTLKINSATAESSLMGSCQSHTIS